MHRASFKPRFTVEYKRKKRRSSGINPNYVPVTTSLQVWLDASDPRTITKDGSDKVSQWSNKRANRIHATQSTGSRQPITGSGSINNLNTLTFNGIPNTTTGATMSLGDIETLISNDNGTTMFVACKPSTTTGVDSLAQTIIAKENRFVPRRVFQFSNIAFEIRETAGSAPAGERVDYTATTDAQILVGRWLPSGKAEAYRDGALLGVASIAVTDVDNTVDAVFIGGTINDTGLEGFGGEIGEIIIYNRSLSMAEILLVNTYLSNKWAIALS